MSLLVIILIIFLIAGGIGTYPMWPHSTNWGYYPSGGIGIVLLILLVLLLSGRI